MSGLYRLVDASRHYGDGARTIRALDGASLAVDAGEMVVVSGPSGSGKSTLLQLMGALDRPTSGRVELEGRDLAGAGDDELSDLRRRTIGFVFQQFNLIPTLTALENVEGALAPAGLTTRERRARARELLALVGLAARSGHLPTHLSGGEQQRVAVARALVNRPRVVLADEPTGNLDVANGAEVLALLERLHAREGLTVVVVTHDPAIAAGAPRVVRLDDGRVVDDSPPDGRERGLEEAQERLRQLLAGRGRSAWDDPLPRDAERRARRTLAQLGPRLGPTARTALDGTRALRYADLALALAVADPQARGVEAGGPTPAA